MVNGFPAPRKEKAANPCGLRLSEMDRAGIEPAT
jgi:hypothetical protein